jgi:hypothetical protein
LFNDDNSSAGSYNDTVPKRKNSDLEEDMLPKQKSNNRKKQVDHWDLRSNIVIKHGRKHQDTLPAAHDDIHL